MALPSLTPKSQVSAITLPATGSYNRVSSNLPFGIYVTDSNFLSGAVDQVSFTYKMLGGDVLDVELTEYNVYAAYEAAILEYSYLINIHQAKNALPSVLGNITGTFNHDGELNPGELSSSLNGTRIELKYPTFDIGYIRQVSVKAGEDAGVGGNLTHYSASFLMVPGKQTYDVLSVVSSSFPSLSGNQIIVRKVYYKSPQAAWRFFGFGYAGGYGGYGIMGNLSSYGQWADDSQFEIVPVWQNKLQAIAYEDALRVRTSHYSYEIQNNQLKLYPAPSINSHLNSTIWFEFTLANADKFALNPSTSNIQIGGINNINTVPFANIPFQNINSIGKQWIRRYALAISKEMLGQIRSKFSVVPIPGENITLNGEALLGQAKDEQASLKEELKTILQELTYVELAKQTSEMEDVTNNVLSKTPMVIFVG